MIKTILTITLVSCTSFALANQTAFCPDPSRIQFDTNSGHFVIPKTNWMSLNPAEGDFTKLPRFTFNGAVGLWAERQLPTLTSCNYEYQDAHGKKYEADMGFPISEGVQYNISLPLTYQWKKDLPGLICNSLARADCPLVES